MNNDVLDHEWGDSRTIFMSDTVTSEHYWRITSRVITKIVIHGDSYLILFLKHREIDDSTHRIVTAPLLFTVGQFVVELWRHTHTAIVTSS